MASSFNTMYDISKSLKLIKDHPLLLMGATYYITESNSNAKIIKVGSGITKLYIRDEYGENYLLEGNANRIKELFQAIMLFENMEGEIYKLKRPIGSLHQNVLIKEISAITADENIYVGGGVTERYFIEKNNNKVIKFIGNSTQIKYLFEKVEPLVEHKITPVKIIEKPVVRLVEKTILRETIPQIGSQGEMGPTGIIGARGEKGDTGEKGDKGDQGNKGDQGEIGPVGEIGPPGIQGVQGIQGPHGQDGSIGPQGDVGPQGLVGPQGIQGKPGSNGQNGKDGIQGAIGPQGPMGEKGDRGEKGEKGDRGQNGNQGISGVAGAVGQKGEKGDKGDKGDIGVSPVITAEYPVILKEGKISFDAQKLTSLLDQFKNQDIQKAIDSFAKTATPGGGGLGILFLGSRVLKSVNDINFTGSGVTVIQRGKGVEVNISGGGGGGDVNQLIAGAGITLSPPGGTGSVTITNLLSLKAVPGAIQFANDDVNDLAANQYLKFDVNNTTLEVPSILKLTGVSSLPAYIEFKNGTLQETAPNTFTYGVTAAAGFTQGDRWMSSDTGIEYVYVNDGNSPQWVQPTNTSSNSTPVSILGTVGVTGATYTASVVDYYIGVSYAGPVTVTLPVAPETGREIVVKDESGNAGNGVTRQITIVGATSAHKIDNQSSAIINLDNAALHFLYRNGWRII
jgi:hypothetical protein